MTDSRASDSLMSRRRVLGAGAALLGARALPAVAQDTYPSRPIKLVVCYAPGGPVDTAARQLAPLLSAKLNNANVLVENRPGGGGTIGAEAVARSAPDGYTILCNASLHVINPSLYTKTRYDAIKDFAPITQLADVPLVLVVNNDLPVKTLDDLVALAKSGQPLSFGSAGNASAQHLSGATFKLAAGIDMQHIPYKGSTPALTDVMGGQVALMFDSMPSAMPYIRGGKLRAVATTTARRAQALPDVPTVAESGYPGFDISTWYALWAPAGTPALIVEKLSEHAARALKAPDVRKQYADLGAEPVGSTPAAFAAYLDSESTKWAKIVKDSGAKAD